MKGNDISGVDELIVVERRHVEFRRTLLRKVPAPGRHLHAEGSRDRDHARAEIAQAHNAQGATAQHRSDPALPPAGANQGILADKGTRRRQNQRPRKLNCTRYPVTPNRAAHDDPELSCCVDVDGGVDRARRHQQAQFRQAREDVAWKGRSLPHDGDDVEGFEAADQCIGIAHVVPENSD
ncbi:MAG: hypothetical protein Q8L23_06850 [Caulobacter sp.]|nr:hypothetical protein [Caulobacter sp.]